MPIRIADDAASIREDMRKLGLEKTVPQTEAASTAPPKEAFYKVKLDCRGDCLYCLGCGVPIRAELGVPHSIWTYSCRPCYAKASYETRKAWLGRVHEARRNTP